jgi:hypothetical protein
MTETETIRINERVIALPPETFMFGRKRVQFFPGSVVFQVYTRKRLSIGTSARLEVSQQLMRKRGRKAGNELLVCVDYSPRGCTAHVARICVGQFDRRGSVSLNVEYAGRTYPEASK